MISTHRLIRSHNIGSASLTRLFTLCVVWLVSGCGPTPQDLQNQALQTAAHWFEQAAASQSTDTPPPTCHAFGLIKYTDASCQDMIDHAASLLPDTREIDSVKLLECYGQGAKEVCGEFAEIWFQAQDAQGTRIKEGMVLKRDDGTFRMYWYRSDTLFTELTRRSEIQDADSTQAQLALQQQRLKAVYTQLVERDPAIYRFPPCIDAQVRSSVMLGGLLAPSEVSGKELEERAKTCSLQLCLALVGRKVAPLCL